LGAGVAEGSYQLNQGDWVVGPGASYGGSLFEVGVEVAGRDEEGEQVLVLSGEGSYQVNVLRVVGGVDQ
jgi:hypothetical protein